MARVAIYLSGRFSITAKKEAAWLKRTGCKHRCFSFAVTDPEGINYSKDVAKALTVCEKQKVNIMMDSGAHSIHVLNRATKDRGTKAKAKQSINIQEVQEKMYQRYVAYCKANKKKWAFYVTLDFLREQPVIYKQQQRFLKDGLHPMPVVHGESNIDYWIRKHADMGHKYIALGGATIHKGTLDFYFDTAFNLAAKLGLSYHGLAFTSLTMITRWPWKSVDSVAGDSTIVVRQANRVRFTTMDELFWTTPGAVYIDQTGHTYKQPWDMETLSMDNGTAVWSPLTKIIRHRHGRSLVDIQTEKGWSVRITQDHSLITTNSSTHNGEDLVVHEQSVNQFTSDTRLINSWRLPTVSEKGLSHLDVEVPMSFATHAARKFGGGQVATIVKTPYRLVLDTEFLEYVGLWLGDGSYNQDKGVHLSCGQDLECRTLFKKILSRFTFSKSSSWSGRYFKLMPNGVDMRAGNMFLHNLMKAIGLEHGSRTKEFPSWVFRLNKYQIGALLRGYFSADGHKNSISSVSSKLFYGTAFLLESLGIRCSVAPSFRKTHKLGGFSNGELPRTGGSIVITDAGSLRTFKKLVNFIQRRKSIIFHKRLQCLSYQGTNGKCKPYRQKTVQFIDAQLVKIRHTTVQPATRSFVYDLEVPDSEMFFVNGLLCHNSSTWSRCAAFGQICFPDFKRMKFYNVHISERGSVVKTSYNTMRKVDKDNLRGIVKDHGFDLDAMRDGSKGEEERHNWNGYMYSNLDKFGIDWDAALERKVEWQALI